MWPEYIYKIIQEREKIDQQIKLAKSEEERVKLEKEWRVIHIQLSRELSMFFDSPCC